MKINVGYNHRFTTKASVTSMYFRQNYIDGLIGGISDNCPCCGSEYTRTKGLTQNNVTLYICDNMRACPLSQSRSYFTANGRVEIGTKVANLSNPSHLSALKTWANKYTLKTQKDVISVGNKGIADTRYDGKVLVKVIDISDNKHQLTVQSYPQTSKQLISIWFTTKDITPSPLKPPSVGSKVKFAKGTFANDDNPDIGGVIGTVKEVKSPSGMLPYEKEFHDEFGSASKLPLLLVEFMGNKEGKTYMIEDINFKKIE